MIEPRKAVVEVSNYVYQTSQFAQTTLRSVLGEGTGRTARPSRKNQPAAAKHSRTHTAPWGVKVANVEVKQVDMPESMLRAMAKQAEAEREKRSKIIHAEGEFSAAQRLVDAARFAGDRAGEHAIALPANLDRNRRGEKHNRSLPGSDGLLFRHSKVIRKKRRRRAGRSKG